MDRVEGSDAAITSHSGWTKRNKNGFARLEKNEEKNNNEDPAKDLKNDDFWI